MPNVVYLSGNVNVTLSPQNDVNVDIPYDDDNVLYSSLDGVRLTYGKVPPGGNNGDIIVKSSNLNYDAEWVDPAEVNLRHIYYDTKDNWNSQIALISERGAVYIYSDQFETDGVVIPGIKIGDGSAYLIDIPFISQNLADRLLAHIEDSSVHVSSNDREFWNNKVTAFSDTSDPENLVLTKEFQL